MPSHAFLGAGASYSCHFAEDAYSAVARAGARWNCLAHNLSSDSAQGGIPADQGWNSTPSRLACAPCMGGTSERSHAPVFIATLHPKCSTLFEGCSLTAECPSRGIDSARARVRIKPCPTNAAKHGWIQNATKWFDRDEVRSREPRHAADVDSPVQTISVRAAHQGSADEAV